MTSGARSVGFCRARCNRSREAGIPITRENYIEVAYFREPPEEWTAEDEMQLPKQLQDWSKVSRIR